MWMAYQPVVKIRRRARESESSYQQKWCGGYKRQNDARDAKRKRE
jgi:hypothetical protein